MKTTKFFVLAALFWALLVGSAFWVGTAYAALGCFSDTNGHWAEAAICWAAENGIVGGFPDGTFKPNNNVTRAQVAVMLKNQADVPPSTGNILVSAGFSRWMPFFSNDPLDYAHFANGSSFRSTLTGVYSLVLHPDVPVALYGKSLSLIGVEICYQTEAGNVLSEVRVRTYTQSTGLASSNLRFSDPADRADTACRYYVLSTPLTLTSETGVSVYMDVNWTTANRDFALGRTTFVFQPTETAAANLSLRPDGSPALNKEEIVLLQEMTGPDTSPEAGR